WSVGLRTPSGPEVLFQLAETLNERRGAEPRLTVSTINPDCPDQVDSALIEQTRTLLQHSLALDDAALGAMLSSFLTRWRLWPNEDYIELDTVTRQLRAGHPVRLAPTARIALLKGEQLFVNGERIECPSELALSLSRERSLSAEWLDHEQALDQLLEAAAIMPFRGPSVVR
ncbi:MAG: winged helix domain-containing protein, partial [Pseudomonadota bacterium]